MPVAVDPLASLAPREVVVRLGDRDYVIPPRPAIDWLEVLLTNNAVAVIPAWFATDDRHAFYVAAMADEFDNDDLDAATSDAITVAAGRPWWLAANLVTLAAADHHTWAMLHGRLVLAGLDSRDAPLGAWLDGLYAGILEGQQDPDSRRRFETAIETPPEGVDIDEESESAAFLALAGSLGMDVEDDGVAGFVEERVADLYPLD